MESTIHIRLNQDLREELEKISKDNEIKLSNVVRTALEDYVNSYSRSTNYTEVKDDGHLFSNLRGE